MSDRFKSKALEAARAEGLKRLEPLAAVLRQQNTTSAQPQPVVAILSAQCDLPDAKYTREQLVALLEATALDLANNNADPRTIPAEFINALIKAGALQVKQ